MSRQRLDVAVVRTREEMARALEVRRAVFIEEQGVPESEEIDAHDGNPALMTTAVHMLVTRDGRAVGTGRLLLGYPRGAHAHVGRVAVVAAERRGGVGTVVMRALEAEARARGFSGITLAAQLQAIPFYKRLGYAVPSGSEGDVFLDAGIEHRWMALAFPPGGSLEAGQI